MALKLTLLIAGLLSPGPSRADAPSAPTPRWIVYRIEALSPGLLPGQILEERAHSVLVEPLFEGGVKEIDKTSIVEMDIQDAREMSAYLTEAVARAQALIHAIHSAGGLASHVEFDKRQVALSRLPSRISLAANASARLAFNHADDIHRLIADLEKLGGRLVWLDGARDGTMAEFAPTVHSPVTANGPKFLLKIGAQTTKLMLEHELTHLRDLISEPIPELQLRGDRIRTPETVRMAIRNFAISTFITGLLETRAFAQSHGRVLKKNWWRILSPEMAGSLDYELINQFKLKFGNFLLRPNLRNLYELDSALGNLVWIVPLSFVSSAGLVFRGPPPDICKTLLRED